MQIVASQSGQLFPEDWLLSESQICPCGAHIHVSKFCNIFVDTPNLPDYNRTNLPPCCILPLSLMLSVLILPEEAADDARADSFALHSSQDP